ncbi:acetate/propionate family kinase [Texas Phoenix palm phytoplasma]|uniref:Acetate kinase n=1 Tax=Texas Phoenix palm phytoplasma TaxID=176709 RepID=A0ABS5BIS0_9MOLU|nr:acetate kinase [Texas Phoenix palm phytoplasma]MBP3059473.1 acetate/propionate family kinase [Texas Phoenix palm phytoplasma]
MKIMSVNAGSSSLKFQLLKIPSDKVLCKGSIEKIGSKDAIFNLYLEKNKKKEKILFINDHQQAIKIILDSLIENKFINKLEEIEGIGHRIVQGGEIFKESVILTDENILKIEKISNLAPLHNPSNVLSIKLFKKILPKVFQVGVFDTTFHSTIPEENFLYAIPYEFYKKYKIRKYGFHGLSYNYICQRIEKILNSKKFKIIVCHIGNGVSVTAIKDGKSIDTSMGFTPLEGVPMGTRSGNIDPTIISFLSEKENKNVDEIIDILNKESGLLGVSGISNDARDLEKMISQNNKQALLAFKIQAKRIVDYISSYYVLLKGVDFIIFTAGIGENSSFVRSQIVERLEILGINLDSDLNISKEKGERIISSKESSVKIMIIPTNEEITIAKEVFRLRNNNI